MVTRWLCIAVLALGVGACKSSKKVDDSAAGTPVESSTQGTPGVDNEPLVLNAQGSDSGKIAGLETINFEYDKAALTSEAKKKIQGNVDWMKSHSSINVQIEGHCDARGSIEYNLSLGERRAKSVKDYMVSLGMAANRLSILSYGKEKPLVNGDSEADMAKNRRANFLPLNQ